jgi:hypothetical protein
MSQLFKLPVKLDKEDVEEYLAGVKIEKETGVYKRLKRRYIDKANIVPVYMPKDCDWIEHLFKKGWATVPIPEFDSSYFVNEFFNWLKSCNNKFDPNDKSTWNYDTLPIMSYGILKHYIGHAEFLWQIREKCHPIFEKIWNTKELLSSFDGACFLTSNSKHKYKDWFHIDQPRTIRDFACVQGIVNLVNNGPDDGGLLLIEDSKDVYDTYMDKHPSYGLCWAVADSKDDLLSNKKYIKICANAGEIILFDSRMFHCNVPCISNNYRMCTYVSMQPKDRATTFELNHRKELYEAGKMTGHWCYGKYFQANETDPHDKVRINNKPSIIEVASISNDLRLSMIC